MGECASNELTPYAKPPDEGHSLQVSHDTNTKTRDCGRTGEEQAGDESECECPARERKLTTCGPESRSVTSNGVFV